ncbi:MAG: DUF1015 domain-containing protein [Bryobacterales bacterium]|nr:DUF1015 domain-containing protein [Bryobacterales bacterium]
MAEIFPFHPYRYTPTAGPLGLLATQPYDKISAAMRERYLESSPYNPVRVILGKPASGDSPSDNVYTRAARHLEDWMGSGILARETEPSLFAYFQEFTDPDTEERLTRKGFIGLGAVEDYSTGVVHRHEQTLSGPKRDRMELLRHTRAHFGQLFMLYPDPDCAVDRILDQAAAGEPTMAVEDEYGAIHRAWKIAEPERIAEIQRLMRSKKLVIADGHHRYETALAFRDANPQLEDARRVMMTFVNMHSPGLKILATHRLIDNLAGFDATQFLEKAASSFRVELVDSSDALRAAWNQPHAGRARIGVAIHGSEQLCLLEAARGPREPDVAVLHQRLLADVLGIGEEAVREERYLRYVRGLDTAIELVRGGSAQMAFLLKVTPIGEVADISFSGGVMPQKSTDFYPKLLSGLAIYKLER